MEQTYKTYAIEYKSVRYDAGFKTTGKEYISPKKAISALMNSSESCYFKGNFKSYVEEMKTRDIELRIVEHTHTVTTKTLDINEYL